MISRLLTIAAIVSLAGQLASAQAIEHWVTPSDRVSLTISRIRGVFEARVDGALALEIVCHNGCDLQNRTIDIGTYLGAAAARGADCAYVRLTSNASGWAELRYTVTTTRAGENSASAALTGGRLKERSRVRAGFEVCADLEAP